MIDGIAHQVEQRIAKPVQDRAIQLDVAPFDDKLDLLAGRLGEIADHADEPGTGIGEGEHAHPANLIVQGARRLLERADVVGKRGSQPLDALLQFADVVADFLQCLDERRGAAPRR